MVAIESSPRTTFLLAQPVKVVLFFTHPVRGIFGLPYRSIVLSQASEPKILQA